MYSESEKFNAFLQNEDATILVVDSGLGGLAICADIASRLSRCHHFKTVSLIYFNAWPEQNRGYNRLGNKAEQLDTFDRALDSMLKFNPDFIMLACNTLSVLYPSTKFYQNAAIPVIDIVDFGVDMIAKVFQMDDSAQVIILGTVTTVTSRVHHDRLLELGLAVNQIILQPCDQLATAIENGPESPLVAEMLKTFLREATLNIDSTTKKVYGALCCTHFGYCQKQFQERLASLSAKPTAVINPNQHLADHLLTACGDRGFETQQRIRVISKIVWDKTRISAISKRIRMVSDETAEALTNYTHVPDLF